MPGESQAPCWTRKGRERLEIPSLWHGNRAILKFNGLHKKKMDIDRIVLYNKLIMASEAGDLPTVKSLLATEGVSANPPLNPLPDARFSLHPFYTAIEGAVHSNQLEIVEILLEPVLDCRLPLPIPFTSSDMVNSTRG
jgi:hypothetical protein